jgi:hypothetical protein
LTGYRRRYRLPAPVFVRCFVTTGLHVIEFTVRRRSDLQIREVVPRIDGRLLLDLIDHFEVGAGMRPVGGAYGG